MIIETKGTKTDGPKQDGVQGLAKNGPEAKSRMPYYLALAVSAVATYLKSLFHEPARAEPDAGGNWAEPPGAPLPRLVLLPSAPDREPDDEFPEPHARGTSSFVQEALAEASEYEVQESVRAQSLRFATTEQRPDLGDFKLSPVIPNPLNDNRGAASAGGGGGGGGGGHGGGRASPSNDAGASRPHPEQGDDARVGDVDTEGHTVPVRPADDAMTRTGRPSGDMVVSDPDGRTGEGGGTRPSAEVGGGPDDKGGAHPTDPTAPGDTPSGRRNRAPVSTGTVHLADTTRCASLAIAAVDLLRAVSDPDGDPLAVRRVTASSGTLARDGDGWLFDPDEVGPVTITYEVTDGEFVITQTATLNVVDHPRDAGTGGNGGVPVGRTATDGDDLILGSPLPDRISGGGGNDNIDARGGGDLIDGGPGDDHIVGGVGNDTILGGMGNDVILAGAGRDVVSGGGGSDRIFGEDGDDILYGDEGDDLVDGGAGSDILAGGSGDDTLYGAEGDDRIDGGDGNDVVLAGTGRDVVSGGAGDDHLEGGAGDDVLSDGAGRDVVLGQEGNDVLVVALDGEDDIFDGGAGIDTLDLSATTSGIVVDLVAGTAVGAEIGRDTVTSVEVVRGGSGADAILGDAGPNSLYGGGGRDFIAGGAGDDLIDGGADGDVLSDGSGSDVVAGGDGDDTLTVASDGEDDAFDGGAGVDTLDLTGTRQGVVVDLKAGTASGTEIGHDLVKAVEAVLGGSGRDSLAGGAEADRLRGGKGDDHLAGRAGDDVIEGGSGRDAIRDGAGRDVVRGDDGDDLIELAMDGDDDQVDGGTGSDTLDLSGAEGDLIVDLVREVVSGTALGSDKVKSVERIVTGSGSDRFVIGDRDVMLTGGAGDDRYEFSTLGGNREPTRAVQITDFSVGDHIDLLKWTFFEETPGTKGGSLAEAMERKDGTVSGIRYKSAQLDDGHQTVITADLDHDDKFETTVVLDGRHTLLFVAAAPETTPHPVPHIA